MLAAILIFIVVAGAVFGASHLMSRRRGKDLRERLDGCDAAPVRVADKRNAPGAMFAALDSLLKSFSFSSILKRELARANWNLKVSEFLLVVLLSASLPPLLLILVTGKMQLGVTLAGPCALMPALLLKRGQAARKKMFASQLLDAISIISNSLKSGYSFLQAIDLVAQEMSPPVSDEFQKVLQEIKLGIPFETAVDRMIVRVGSDDLELVMTGVKIQREVGGNLTEILDKIAHTIRERLRIKGQIQTLTAQGRLSGLILFLLPVALGFFLFMVNPDYMLTLVRHPAGRMMMGFAVVSQVIGGLIIKKIINIKV